MRLRLALSLLAVLVLLAGFALVSRGRRTSPLSAVLSPIQSVPLPAASEVPVPLPPPPSFWLTALVEQEALTGPSFPAPQGECHWIGSMLPPDRMGMRSLATHRKVSCDGVRIEWSEDASSALLATPVTTTAGQQSGWTGFVLLAADGTATPLSSPDRSPVFDFGFEVRRPWIRTFARGAGTGGTWFGVRETIGVPCNRGTVRTHTWQAGSWSSTAALDACEPDLVRAREAERPLERGTHDDATLSPFEAEEEFLAALGPSPADFPVWTRLHGPEGDAVCASTTAGDRIATPCFLVGRNRAVPIEFGVVHGTEVERRVRDRWLLLLATDGAAGAVWDMREWRRVLTLWRVYSVSIEAIDRESATAIRQAAEAPFLATRPPGATPFPVRTPELQVTARDPELRTYLAERIRNKNARDWKEKRGEFRAIRRPREGTLSACSVFEGTSSSRAGIEYGVVSVLVDTGGLVGFEHGGGSFQPQSGYCDTISHGVRKTPTTSGEFSGGWRLRHVPRPTP